MIFSGLKLSDSRYIPDGTYVYSRGGQIVGISTAERRAFLAKFGLEEGPPPGADGVIMSPGDYAKLRERIEEIAK